MLYRNTLLMFSKQLRMRDIDAHGNTLCEMCRTLHIGGHMMQGSGVNPTDAIAMLMQTVILPPLFFVGAATPPIVLSILVLCIQVQHVNGSHHCWRILWMTLIRIRMTPPCWMSMEGPSRADQCDQVWCPVC